MRCADLAENLTEFLEGELSASQESVALEHLATCENCERILSETREVMSMARDHGRPKLGPSDRARMLESITSSLPDS